MLSSKQIKLIASEVGFNLCGVARVRSFEGDDGEFFRRWLAEGYAPTLGYMHRNIERRLDASLLVEGARSVVVCGVSYKNIFSDGYPDGTKIKIASYACCKDYHATIKNMLHRIAERLACNNPSLRYRAFVDSAPLLEKHYAVEAGLGWIGRQSLLVNPEFGSFILLGELVIAEECNEYDHPIESVGCGNCRRCLDACPNGAIKERHIDTSRCISCATVEHSDNNLPLNGWAFGCDECQSCCPYNKRASYHTLLDFDPVLDPRTLSTEDWQRIKKGDVCEIVSQTPLARRPK